MVVFFVAGYFAWHLCKTDINHEDLSKYLLLTPEQAKTALDRLVKTTSNHEFLDILEIVREDYSDGSALLLGNEMEGRWYDLTAKGSPLINDVQYLHEIQKRGHELEFLIHIDGLTCYLVTGEFDAITAGIPRSIYGIFRKDEKGEWMAIVLVPTCESNMKSD